MMWGAILCRTRLVGVESLAGLSCSYPRSCLAEWASECWGPSSSTHSLILGPQSVISLFSWLEVYVDSDLFCS